MKNTSDNYRKSASYIKRDYYENYLSTMSQTWIYV